jgi:transposase
MRPRRGSKPACSGSHERGTAYDQLGLRRFEFVPVWGFIVLLLYRMRRVDCRACGVRVEEVPWATGKHQLTKAYMLFLAHWARKLSWQETAVSFRSSWDKVRQAVEYVVEWGLAHRSLGPILAIGVDEIQYGKGHKYLTLVYQIEQECTRLLWVGKERTVESFEQFFTLIGAPLSEKIEYVCGFHYDPKVVLQALQRIQRMRVAQKAKKQRKQSSDVLEATCAKNIKDTFYHPALLVENNAVVHGIFAIAADLSEKETLEETDKIVDRLHKKSTMLAGFAARFIAKVAPER